MNKKLKLVPWKYVYIAKTVDIVLIVDIVLKMICVPVSGNNSKIRGGRLCFPLLLVHHKVKNKFIKHCNLYLFIHDCNIEYNHNSKPLQKEQLGLDGIQWYQRLQQLPNQFWGGNSAKTPTLFLNQMFGAGKYIQKIKTIFYFPFLDHIFNKFRMNQLPN